MIISLISLAMGIAIGMYNYGKIPLWIHIPLVWLVSFLWGFYLGYGEIK